MDEQLLVKKCLEGDYHSQKQLYERFAPKMLGICYRYAMSMQEAEDFLQEAFITIFRKLDQFRNEGSLEPWVRRIMINTSIDGVRARWKFTEHLDKEEIANLPANGGDTHMGQNGIMELVRQLSPGCRTIFNLHAVEGYTHEEIAAMLGIKPGTCRSQYKRAREILMKKLGSEPQNDNNGNDR